MLFFGFQYTYIDNKFVSSQEIRLNRKTTRTTLPLLRMKTSKRILLSIAFLIATLTMSAQKAEIVSHTVAQGQTLYSISKLYNTTVDEIIKFNPGSAEKLSIGQKLIIPRNSNSKAKDGKNVKTHTIQQGETLYRLSKMYNVTTDELCAANPGLSINNFRTGETIIIPVKGNAPKDSAAPVAPRQSSYEEKKPVIVGTHKVQRRESIESICKIYGITQEELIKANPVLQETKLKRKMVLHIPAPSARPAEKEIAVEEKKQEIAKTINKGINDDKVLNVAVVLSFLLDSYAPKEQGRMVEYYQGFLMAVEQLKREGYSFVINTYDTGQKDRSLDSLLSSSAFDNVEMIFGASYPKHNKELAKFAYEKNIPLVVPFTNKDDEIYNNPMVYCVNVLQSYLIPEVNKHFMTAFPNANVVFVENEEEKSNKKEFITKLTNELDINNVPNTTVPLYNLTTEETTLITLKEFLREDKENIIIPTSSSAATLNMLLPTLQQADMIDSLDIPDYKLFGYPEWQIYAKDTREQMYEVETFFYATFYSHYSIPEITRFQEEYIKRYNCNIQNIYPRYGMLGYDTGYFFLLATTIYGELLPEKINDLKYTPIQTGFLFERLKDGAMINKKINFIHYTPDYRIEKIDFE